MYLVVLLWLVEIQCQRVVRSVRGSLKGCCWAGVLALLMALVVLALERSVVIGVFDFGWQGFIIVEIH